MRYKLLIMGALFISGSVINPLHANSPNNNIIAIEKSAEGFSMVSNANAKNISMTITGPDGFYVKKFVPNSGINLDTSILGELKDGVYKYEFTASSTRRAKPDHKNKFNNGRPRAEVENHVSYESDTQSGQITVRNGQIVTGEEE